MRDVVDVAIIGGGVVGCAIARELSKFELQVLLLEAAGDVSMGATKANSGIVHGGYDAKHGTLKSKLSRKGNRMFSQLDQELDFGFKEVGSLVMAFKEEDVEKLQDLLENGRKNGVDDLEIISGDQVHEMEPHASIGVWQALHCPSAGIVSPYEFCFALAENAVANGAKIKVNSRVCSIEPLLDLKTKDVCFKLRTVAQEEFKARIVLNAAGLYADEVARMANAGVQYSITARKGQYILLDKPQGKMAKSVIFQTPTEKWGKGILVSPTVSGNLLLGPSAAEQESKTEKNTDLSELAYVAWAARRSIPHLDTREAIRSFSGLRARSSRHDFIIEADNKIPNFIHVAGIESPGLTASPAIAEMVCTILEKDCACPLVKKTSFDPKRKHPRRARSLESGIVCLCEAVTKSEIAEALNSTSWKLSATDSIKWRTRAGMGHCQGVRCQRKVAELIAEYNGTSVHEVTKRIGDGPEAERIQHELLSRL